MVLVFVAAAVAAPPVYHGVRAAAQHAPVLEALARHPFHRFLHRLLLVFALAGLPLLLRTLGLRGWRALGLAAPRAHRRAVAVGAGIGAATVLVMAALAAASGARAVHADLTASRLALRLLGALAVAPLVALVEEVMFRGVFERGLRRSGGAAAALAASSVFYAIVHFFRRPPNPPVVAWDSGFALLGHMLAGFGDVAALVPGFLTLCALGACFARLSQRTGSLYAGVGVHAGGIFVLQLQGAVLAAPAAADRAVWGSGALIDGWVALAVVGAAAFGVAPLVRRGRALWARAGGEPVDVTAGRSAPTLAPPATVCRRSA